MAHVTSGAGDAANHAGAVGSARANGTTSALGAADQDDDLPILRRRRIEAGIVAPIYRVMVREIGAERAREIIREAIAADARAQGARMARREEEDGRPADLTTFIALQELWKADDALVTETLTATPERYDYDVTRCRYAEMYQEMGIAEIGELLSCARDYEFPLGFDGSITLQRTTTIMTGARRCDFRYRRPPTAPAPTPEETP